MDLYGGSGTHLLQSYPLINRTIRSKIKSVLGASKSRRRIFAFPSSMPELNTHFPTHPGAHGLMFGMNYEIETVILKNDGQMICEIFAPPLKDRSCNSRKAIEYYGTYRISESRTMTAEEFSKQTKAVSPFHIIVCSLWSFSKTGTRSNCLEDRRYRSRRYFALSAYES